MTVLKNAGAQKAADDILAAFENGDMAEPLARMYLKTNAPMKSWSVMNEFFCQMAKCTDARGYRQWEAVGRNVIKGQKARTYILVPMIGKKQGEGGDSDSPFVYGFKGVPVFDIAQTEGDDIESPLVENGEFLRNLPLLEVAQAWGVDLATYDPENVNFAGYYLREKNAIHLGIENVTTWLHELVHKADDLSGNMVEDPGHWAPEVVAQLGASVLATMLGLEIEADLAHSYRYISRYAASEGLDPLTACRKVLDRTHAAVGAIIATAGTVQA